MLKFYVKHGVIVDKVQEIISFRQSYWLEKYVNFNTQTKNQAVNDFEKDFYKLLKNPFYGKTIGNFRKRIKTEYNKKDADVRIIKQQSKFIFQWYP